MNYWRRNDRQGPFVAAAPRLPAPVIVSDVTLGCLECINKDSILISEQAAEMQGMRGFSAVPMPSRKSAPPPLSYLKDYFYFTPAIRERDLTFSKGS